MPDDYQHHLAKLIDAIVAKLPKDASADLRSFTRQYYLKVPIMDLEKLDPARAVAIAASGYAFVQTRQSGSPSMRLFSPEAQRDGYTAAQLVLEIANDDMSFLVDSTMGELNRLGLVVSDVIHPILRLRRDLDGKLIGVAPADDVGQGFISESLIHFELSALPAGLTPEKLLENITQVLRAVRYVVTDWQAMTAKVADTARTLQEAPRLFKSDEVEELRDFLGWLQEKNFVFLGYIEYDFYDKKKQQSLSVVPGSELGIFKADGLELKPQGLQGLPPDMLHFALLPQMMEITKSVRPSMVHRTVPMDYIGIKRFDKSGQVIGERRFLGLFTSIVYYQSAAGIPIIRRKINRVLARANFDPMSHDGKSLKAILEFAPRDELFQMSEDDVFNYGIGVLSLEARPAVRLFVRKDAFERFVSAIIFLPRERFSTSLREQIQSVLEQAFNGTISDFYTQVTNAPLARVQFIIKTTPGQIPSFSADDIETQIVRLTNLWADSLREELLRRHTREDAIALAARYANAFPTAYSNFYTAVNAGFDIDKIEQALATGQAGLELYRTANDNQYIHLKLYNPREQVPLSDVLPMLENLGFRVIDENPFQINLPESTVWVRDFLLSCERAVALDIQAIKPRLEEALARLWNKEAENDGLNALVLRGGLTWREVALLRAYGKYIGQTAAMIGYSSIVQALNANAMLARKLVDLFQARFSLEGNVTAATGIIAEIDDLLAEVTNATHDRIIRRYADLMQATLRTNYFKTLPTGRNFISFKLASAQVPDLPLPRPYAEIFVYSPRFEGIHLRGGKVARGGLRWSDRPDDFRTEILGLMKAQMVKNSVIVPVGSKGGFVLKAAPPASDRDAFLKEGIACYQNFLRGLLDLTDNIVDGAIVPPPQVVRQDGDDPYLVVAADKGTASFSDYANAVSAEYGFWLGDAFASGGSVGYDHKKMAITARGAFISVARHFREMGVDIYAQDFTAVGIGDMSGDVFGNGALLSPHMRLLAAFDHRHIFIDPNPDAKKSIKERERLFNLPRSSWMDYEKKLISKGGGIYDRGAKTIAISKEAMAALGLTRESYAPEDLIHALLLAPVDLLFNGGIGTYVKAEEESNEQVGDRTNNAVRVNGKELCCKVVGEGGNLGFTQKGRIEYARNGGRINTDAIDNSAGVDTSDHEVNIKIALGPVVASGHLSVDARNALLATMSDDVAQLVLSDNRLQTQAVTIAQLQGAGPFEAYQRLMQNFERLGELNRAVEFLPNDKQIQERRAQKQGLTRPELAVLLSYSKMVLYPRLLESDLPEDPYYERDLLRYFPAALQKQYADDLKQHRLKREIIATVATNDIVNRTGIVFVHAIAEDTGVKLPDVVRAVTIAFETFGLAALWQEIESLDGKIPVERQAELFVQLRYFLERTTLWILRNAPHPLNILPTVAYFAPGIETYLQHYKTFISDSVREAYEEKVQRFAQDGVPAALVEKTARMEIVSSAPDVVKVSLASGLPVPTVGKIYFEIGARLKLGWLRRAASRMPAGSYFDRLAAQSVIHQLFDQQRRIVNAITATGCDENACLDVTTGWMEKNEKDIVRYLQFVEELRSKDVLDFPRLIVALRHIEALGAQG